MAAPVSGGGMGDVVARVTAIQARIGGLVAATPGASAVPRFDLAAGSATVGTPPPPEPRIVGGGAGGAVADTAVPEPRILAPAPRETSAAADAAPTTAPAGGVAPAGRVAAPADGTAAPSSTGGATATPGPWAAKLSPQGQRWAPAIQAAADAAGIDASLLAALVRHESNFDPSVTSHAGAIGLAQLMPGTAAGLGVDPHDPHQNLAGGARYLRSQLDRFGSPDLALAAYNAGPNRVARAGGIPRIAETTAYVQRVMNTWESLR